MDNHTCSMGKTCNEEYILWERKQWVGGWSIVWVDQNIIHKSVTIRRTKSMKWRCGGERCSRVYHTATGNGVVMYAVTRMTESRDLPCDTNGRIVWCATWPEWLSRFGHRVITLLARTSSALDVNTEVTSSAALNTWQEVARYLPHRYLYKVIKVDKQWDRRVDIDRTDRQVYRQVNRLTD